MIVAQQLLGLINLQQQAVTIRQVLVSAQEQQKKEIDVETKPQTQMEDAIYTNVLKYFNIMNNKLFAIDYNTDEIIVSESMKGSHEVVFIERIDRNKAPILFSAVSTLVSIAKSPKIDTQIFESMDKVCQMIYQKIKEG